MASDPGTTAAIGSDGTNTIQVTANGTSFTAFVNGQQVTNADIPEAPASGSFGLCIGGSETAGGEAAFDNYQVRVG